jgi:hypothetical protein
MVFETELSNESSLSAFMSWKEENCKKKKKKKKVKEIKPPGGPRKLKIG